MRKAYKVLKSVPAGMSAIKEHTVELGEKRKMMSCLNLNSLYANKELAEMTNDQMTILFELTRDSVKDEKNFSYNERSLAWSWSEKARRDYTIPTTVREFTDLAMIIRLRQRLKNTLSSRTEEGVFDQV